MRKKIMNKIMKFIRMYSSNQNEEQLEIIEYGLEAIYITITKTIIIFIIAYFLGILKEMVLFLPFYIIIRLFAFGFHAKDSIQCLLVSSTIFFGTTYLCKFVVIPTYIKVLLCIINILLIYKWAPADTEKHPIINKKRRNIYKTLSTLIAITFSFISILITNQYLSNCLIISVSIECLMISPFIYKLFKLPYDNYKNYLNYGLN